MLNKKFVTVSTAVLLSVAPISTTGVAYASSNVHVTTNNTSSVVTIKKSHLLDQNGKKLPIVVNKGQKYTIYGVLNIGKKTLYQINKSANYWINSAYTKGKVNYKSYGANYSISTNDNVVNSKPHAQSSSITLKNKAYLYNKAGKRLGSMYIAKNTQLINKGTIKIKGKLYYVVNDGVYIKAGNVKATGNSKPHAQETTSKKAVKKETTKIGRPDNWVAGDSTLKLKKNAIPYDEKGNKRTDLSYTYIKKNTVLNFYGTKQINGKTYYDLGNNVYINSANVGKVVTKK